MKSIFLPVCMLLTIALNAQMAIEWQKRFGGKGSDGLASLTPTNDGGTIAIGTSNSTDGDVTGLHGGSNDFDVWVAKISASGELQWQGMYGGTGFDKAFCIQQTRDGGYIFAGYTRSNDGDISINYGGYADCWVVKLDNNGAIQWEKTYGLEDIELGISIRQSNDGGYYVAGQKFDDYWLFKIDALGEIQWDYTYGGTKQENLISMDLTTDNGCIITGTARSDDGDVTGNHGDGSSTYGNPDYWVVKVDSMGILEWEKCLGGLKEDQGKYIIQTQDGGYLVSGTSKSDEGDVSGHHGTAGESDDIWLVKLDHTGAIEWQKSLGGSLCCEIMNSAIETPDGGFIVAGKTYSTDGDVVGTLHGESDAWIVKLDQNGQIESQKLIGGSLYDEIFAIVPSPDGGFVCGGSSYSNDGDVIAPLNPTGPSDDFWIVKLNDFTDTKDIEPAAFQLAPNPTTGSFAIQATDNDQFKMVTVSDLLGNKMLQMENIPDGKIDISTLTGGIYFISTEYKDGRKVGRKLVKE